MNQSKIDQLVNQYLTSINTDVISTTSTSTAPLTSNIGYLTNANTYYYPFNGSTISTNANSSATT